MDSEKSSKVRQVVETVVNLFSGWFTAFAVAMWMVLFARTVVMMVNSGSYLRGILVVALFLVFLLVSVLIHRRYKSGGGLKWGCFLLGYRWVWYTVGLILFVYSFSIVLNAEHSAMVRVMDRKTHSHQTADSFQWIDCEKQQLLMAEDNQYRQNFGASHFLSGKWLSVSGLANITFHPDSAINVMSRMENGDCILFSQNVFRDEFDSVVRDMAIELAITPELIIQEDPKKFFTRELQKRLEEKGWSIKKFDLEKFHIGLSS